MTISRPSPALRTLLVAAAAVTLAGCGSLDRTPDPGPPGAGGPMPAIRLEAVEHRLDQLHDWARMRSDKYGIPLRALQSYGYAAVVMAKAQPGCHLGWTTLAGIARVESNHARFGGAVIAADGSVRPVIRGVALDGTAGNAVIVDPTARSGGGVYARAMGPFQFIPDTWQRWGVHADADYRLISSALESGKPVSGASLSGSPDNIDDAALAAGRYLCAGGRDLATARDWRQAILSYNHSGAYVDSVRAAATGYDA
ncbi:lytic transglycosylase domain-containing protein [Nocardia tengchongensis]|uniref:lytic transglycosylase domain-containing protein n=1 Tax=Nocardia tengchongensis TaxID=2055889 RepID=UPI00360955FA